MVDVKVCGISDEATLGVAADSGARWAGFVLHPDSPRNVLDAGPDPLARLRALVGEARRLGLQSVILMVDPRLEQVAAVAAMAPDAIQFHGREDAAFLNAARGLMPAGMAIWKAVGIAGPDDLPGPQDFPPADRLLLDARPPAGAGRTGGHGVAFDWSILAGWAAPRPWLLAGGLKPDNVAEALRVSGAPALDVSSGVESAPGVKDPDRVRAFMRAAKHGSQGNG